MPKSKNALVLAILIITVGVGHLLVALDVGPGINWVWTLGLAIIGILSFILAGGIDKWSIVLGPFFLIASVLSILRQTGSIKVDIEMPILLIALGVLLLIAQLPAIPLPRWYTPPGEQRK